MMKTCRSGALLVISGPSGCGKSSLISELIKNIDNYYFSVSTTTREKRIGEIEAKDYYFTSKEEFEKGISKGEFLEWARVHDNYYGTSLKATRDALKDDKLIIFDIDVQGHEIIRKKLAFALTSVFITSPTLESLKKRLSLRKTDEEENIATRLENAQREMDFIHKYDYFLINDDLKTCVKDLLSIARVALLKSTLYDKEKVSLKWIDES